MARKHRGKIKSPKRAGRHLWVGFKPYGAGETKPNHYKEIVNTVWDNRHNLPYAWRILSKGVCDGCALGVAGFNDWTIDGVHLCTTRLNLLKYNTMAAIPPTALDDVARVAEARQQGAARSRPAGPPDDSPRGRRRLPSRHVGRSARRDRRPYPRTTPDRLAVYLTARGITNEVYYVAQKVTRFLGTNNVDNAARVCHAPSTGVLRKAIGAAATTCSYTDVIHSDLIVLFGANVANAQPVFMKYLFLARKRGAKVAVVNPLKEPGLERYWVPSNVESAMFGTKMTDEFFGVHTGGDVAFVNGVLKVLLAEGGIDRAFIHDHTEGFDELLAELEGESFADLERQSGASRGRHGAVRAHVRSGAERGAHLVDGHHAARARVRRRRRGRESRAGPWQHRPTRCGAHADPGAFRSAGRRGDGCLRHRVPRWRADHAGVRRHARGDLRVPGERTTRAHRRGDDRGRLPGRDRCPLLVGWQLPRGAARSRVRGRCLGRGSRCGCIRTSSCRARCSSTRRHRRPAARGHPVRAAGRWHGDHHGAPHCLQS